MGANPHFSIYFRYLLAVQDTTSVGFGDRKSIKGMGYYCSTEQKGMLLHTCIAVTDQGIPLGILYQETNTRETRKDDSETKEQKKARPIEEKESFRWLKTMKETHKRVPEDIRVLTVCDREGDFLRTSFSCKCSSFLIFGQ